MWLAAGDAFERVSRGHKRLARVPVPGLWRGHGVPRIGDRDGARLGQMTDWASMRRVASERRLQRGEGTACDEDRNRRAATLSLAPPTSL